MNKQLEQLLQQMMECLFARQIEEMDAKPKACQGKADANEKARHEQFQQEINDYMVACVED
jgi:hypothetical protein